MNLALRRARANRPPADQIGDKLAGNHIQEFRRGGQTEAVNIEQNLARQVDAAVNVKAAIQIGIGDQSFPAHHGARLFKIGAHHDFQAIGVALAQRIQPLRVVERGARIVQRAGADNHQQTRIFAGQNPGDALARAGHVIRNVGGERMGSG